MVSPNCRVCRADLLAGYVRSDRIAERADVRRQMQAELCDSCSRLTINAARDLIRAADEVRVLSQLGIDWEVVGGHYPNHRSRFAALLERVKTAEHRCEELKMWPRHGGTKRPPWFYGDERRNK